MARQQDDDLFLDDLADDLLGDGDDGAPAAAPTNDSGKDTTATTQEDFFADTAVPGQLALDVFQTKAEIIIMAPVPGVSKNDIDLSLVENSLTIRGTRRPPENVPESDYFAQELHWGEFSRQVILPAQVKEDGAEAILKDGMLTVRIPKAEQEKIKKIEIQ